MRVVTTRALNGISSCEMSSPHSAPRNLAETGLSSGASRNGFAAYAETARKIEVVTIAIGHGFTAKFNEHEIDNPRWNSATLRNEKLCYFGLSLLVVCFKPANQCPRVLAGGKDSRYLAR